jgi:hypothetical protein
MLAPLADATERIGEVALFAFPPEALKEVVLGVRASADTKSTILTAIATDPRLAQVSVSQVALDLASGSLLLRPYGGA